MTIPLSKDFSITPTVLGVGGNALDTLGLILSQSALLQTGMIQEFVTKADVLTLFGESSAEYKMASIYFSGAENAPSIPAKLLMTCYISDSNGVAGWLRSAPYGKIKIADINALPAGTLTLNIDGTTETTPSIDLSTATSFDNIAQLLETAIGDTKATVEWNAQIKSFIIISKTLGANSSVSVSAGTLADSLLLTASKGAIVSQGAIQSEPITFMTAITDQNQDWVAFALSFDAASIDVEKFASWANSTNSRYAYCMHDNTSAIINSQNAQCNMTNIIAENDEGVIATYGDCTQAALVLSFLASINFNVTNGRSTLKFRTFTGVAPTVTSGSQANNAESNGYNYYGKYSLNNTKADYYAQGKITGKFAWVDSWINSVWINANLVAAFTNLFTEYQSQPFNSDGYAAVSAVVLGVAQRALNFGAIRTGITLSASQINTIKQQTGGLDISQSLQSKGWYFYIPKQDPILRGERKLSGAVFFYCDGGAIQSISMQSTEVQ